MRRGHQVARSWLIASSATGLGATSHLLAGGHMPHPLVLALATSLAALLTLGMTRLKLPRTSLALGVLAGQGILHALYSHGQPLAPAAAGHHYHGLELLSGAVGLEPLAHAGPAMWAGHTLAAAITFALLAYGEHLLLALRALLGYVRARLEPVRVRPLLGAPTLPVAATATYLVSLLARTCRAPRGPPVLA
ncbi:MAG TPA: hypothetical protein H9821_10090 [Candidatus Rothia avicola]|uniref:Uncharacterized protein n=1 Tax=Candidatus Rothia avicola TaxID=2840478 RepID=A0A9D1ZUY4_9MICC|nr:hypothetical protein [Candidatus Rothia avicola]